MHVAIYARVSTTRQADNDLSIPDQLRQLREWCERNDHIPVHQGQTVGIKEIVKILTQRGVSMRGRPWSIQKIHDILSSRAYIGEHYFNVLDSKTGKKRPPAEWMLVKSDPVVDMETFDRARTLREARSPKNTPPRLINSPSLLTGLPFDEVLEKRAQELKARREALLIERAGVGREHALPVDRILPSRVEAFSKAIQAKLRDKAFAKRYLQTLVDEIVVSEDTATIRGSYAALAEAIAEKKKGTSEEVPSFMYLWRARSDSNARPLGS